MDLFLSWIAFKHNIIHIAACQPGDLVCAGGINEASPDSGYSFVFLPGALYHCALSQNY